MLFITLFIIKLLARINIYKKSLWIYMIASYNTLHTRYTISIDFTL